MTGPSIGVRILGPLELHRDGHLVDVGAGRQRALLALLAIHANEVVPAERLVDALWGERPSDAAAHSLVVYVSSLRRVLEPDRAPRGKGALLRTQAPGYVLDLAPEALDSVCFERLTREGRAAFEVGEAEAAASLLREALALWRGPALADFSYEDFARTEAARLDEARLSALEARLDADLALGRHSQVVGELEAMANSNPLREAFWSKRMLALYRCGRQAEALRAYQDLRHILLEELGIEPSPSAQALEEAILLQKPHLDWAPPERVPENRPRSLPTGVITFLLTDIEGSSTLWEAYPRAMADALARHDELVAETVESCGGSVLKAKGEGDATLSVFQRASDALQAAFDLQQNLAAEAWAGGIDLRVRLALHTGESQERDNDYYGPALNRAARLRGLARGGQVVVSHTTADVTWERLPVGATLVDLGHHELRGLSRGERVFELCREPSESGAGLAGADTTAPFEVRYAPSGDRHVAYQVFGNGPIDLLLLPSEFISIDMAREEPHYAQALEFLGSFCRVIRFDRAGIGLSDPVGLHEVGAIERWVDDAVAVLDAVHCEKAAVMGTQGGGGQAAMLLAATHPSRVAALVLFQTYARLRAAPDYPIGWDPVATDDFLNTVTAPDTGDDASFDLLRTTDPTVGGDRSFQKWWKRAGLHGATPATARAIRSVQVTIDLRQVLPLIQAPSLVLHRSGDTTYFSPSFGRYIAERIPDAQFVELPGSDNVWWIDSTRLLEEVREFLSGLGPVTPGDQVLAAVLVIDVVDTKKIAPEAGDRYWHQVMDHHRAVAQVEVERYGGRLFRATGDGMLATFEGPVRGIRCAGAIRDAVRELGNDVRAGIHVGEIEVAGGEVRGTAVQLAARVMANAAPGEMLVSSSVPPLVVGSGIEFGDRGKRELNRLPEGWRLFRVERYPDSS